jgi:protease-4
MDSLILVPEFNRLADWCGLWSMEPLTLGALVEQLRRIDLAAHVHQQPLPLKSAAEKVPARGGQSIALIKVIGTMMKSQSSMGGTSTVQIRRDIRQAAADPEVSSILMAFDTPGGTVAGTADLASDIRAARKTKPVIAHVDDLCASAGYHAASQCEAIYANSADALVGSIGTMATVYDVSEAAKVQGIRAFLFATGPLKGAGTEGTQLTEEQQAYFQSLIDESQKTFDKAVRLGRGMSDKQLADVRTGAVWTAENAIGLKLIDGIQSLEKTVDSMKRSTSGKASTVNAGHSAEHGCLPTVRHSLPMKT